MYSTSTAPRHVYPYPIDASSVAISDSPVECFPPFPQSNDSMAQATTSLTAGEYAAYAYQYYMEFAPLRSNTPLPLPHSSTSSLASALIGPDSESVSFSTATASYTAVATSTQNSSISHALINPVTEKHTRFPSRENVSLVQGNQGLGSEGAGSYRETPSQSDISTLESRATMEAREDGQGFAYTEQGDQGSCQNSEVPQHQNSFHFPSSSSTASSENFWVHDVENTPSNGMHGFNGDPNLLGPSVTPSSDIQQVYGFEPYYNSYAPELARNVDLTQTQEMMYGVNNDEWIQQRMYNQPVQYTSVENSITPADSLDAHYSESPSTGLVVPSHHSEANTEQSYSELRPVENSSRPYGQQLGFELSQQQWTGATPTAEGSLSVVPLRPQQTDGSSLQSHLPETTPQNSQCLPVNPMNPHSTLPSEKHRTRTGPLQGHHVEMAPPPVPVRSSTFRHTDSGKQAASAQRQHAGVNVNASGQQAISAPRAGAPTAAEGLHSLSDNRSSESQVRSDDVPTSSPSPPRIKAANMNDSMFVLAQKYNRTTLRDTYRLRHNTSPPVDMKILETSALERSKRNDNYLTSLLKREEHRVDTANTNTTTPSTSTQSATQETMSDEEFFNQDFSTSSGWRPALSSRQIREQNGAHLRESIPSLEDTASQTEETTEDVTSDNQSNSFRWQAQSIGPSGAVPDPLNPPPHSKFTKKILNLIRHDGHIHGHISGEGGVCGSAYDGRSYLPDDAESDEAHIPPPPPGARSGEKIKHLCPHPMAVRGETWSVHPLVRRSDDQPSQPTNEGEEESSDLQDESRASQLISTLEHLEVEGSGYGFVEGGSHGPGMGLGSDFPDFPGNKKTRPKLTTDKKGPPKLACLFCRNRKIACGIGQGEDKTCNQCKRRNLECRFPSESRRGMRNKKQNAVPAAEGADDAEADGVEHEQVQGRSFESQTTNGTQKRKPGRPRKVRDAEGAAEVAIESRSREKTKRKNKSKDKESANKRLHMMDGNEDEIEQSENDITTAATNIGGESDPLASLAAEMHEHEARNQTSLQPPNSFFTSFGTNDTQDFSNIQVSNLNPEGYGSSSSLRLAP